MRRGGGGPGDGSHRPWNNFSGFGGPSGRGGRPGSETLVADMKLGAVGHYNRIKCPPFQEPSHIAGYSRHSDGTVHFDESSLRRFRREIFHANGINLNDGFDTYVEKKEDSAGSGFGDLLACIRNKQIPLDNIHFVTFRNNLNKILGTAYNRQDVWEMGVHKRKGTVYLDVHKLPEARHADVETQKRLSYWGYSYESFATEAPSSRQVNARKSTTAVDANVEFCAVVKTTFGAHRIIMGAEMDCFDTSGDGIRHFVELKTNRVLDLARNVDKFERYKLLKFWIQSFLAGVQQIVVGYRIIVWRDLLEWRRPHSLEIDNSHSSPPRVKNGHEEWRMAILGGCVTTPIEQTLAKLVINSRDDAGRLLHSRMMKTQEITQRVKQWEGGVCLAFADQVLCWLHGSVKEDEDYTLRFNRHDNRLELVKANSCPSLITAHMELLAGATTQQHS